MAELEACFPRGEAAWAPLWASEDEAALSELPELFRDLPPNVLAYLTAHEEAVLSVIDEVCVCLSEKAKEKESKKERIKKRELPALVQLIGRCSQHREIRGLQQDTSECSNRAPGASSCRPLFPARGCRWWAPRRC